MCQATISRRRKIVIVGAGPVGCLSAIALAKHGWDIDIFEARPGMPPFPSGYLQILTVKFTRYSPASPQGCRSRTLDKPGNIVPWSRRSAMYRRGRRGPYPSHRNPDAWQDDSQHRGKSRQTNIRHRRTGEFKTNLHARAWRWHPKYVIQGLLVAHLHTRQFHSASTQWTVPS
jgi:choline dehydrogenase-like flavoprotein